MHLHACTSLAIGTEAEKQLLSLCPACCGAAWLAHITAFTIATGFQQYVCFAEQRSNLAAMCIYMHAPHLLGAHVADTFLHRLCQAYCGAALLAHINAFTIATGSQHYVCFAEQRSNLAAMCIYMHAHH